MGVPAGAEIAQVLGRQLLVRQAQRLREQPFVGGASGRG
jgi:hypothetical protein